MARVLVAMSGGVDSSVAALLLKQAGHDCIGIFMRHGQHAPAKTSSCSLPILSTAQPGKQGCCSASDAEDARKVADQLGIPFYAINFDREFTQIKDYFVREYTAGRTPNPCVMCNNWVKFGKLLEYAEGVSADFVATGHYAQIRRPESVPSGVATEAALCRGADPLKDQSYVLFGIDRQVLPRLMFPVGGFQKPAIRELARQHGLPVAEKPDSQEICFVPDGDHAAFIKESSPQSDTSGELVLTDGTVVGTHMGLEQFTIGQRKGLGVAFGEPRYVVRIEPDTRRVVIGKLEELARREATANSANWLVDATESPRACTAKIRYLSRPARAVLTPLSQDRFGVQFEEPQFGVAPGQALVCYEGEQVIAGGWIE